VPDISLRFNKDLITITPPAESYLCTAEDEDALHACLVGLLEPETLEHTYRMIMATGAQCVSAPTTAFTPARLRSLGMEAYADVLASNALEAAHAFSPQHVLLEANPCNLPFDPSKKADMKEYCSQYTSFGRLFENLNSTQNATALPLGADIMPSLTLSNEDIDGYLLSRFNSLGEMKCALIGLRKVTDRPIFTSMHFSDNALTADSESIETACRGCEDLESAVFGIEVDVIENTDFDAAIELVGRAKAACNLPLMVDLVLHERTEKAQAAPGATRTQRQADALVLKPDIMFDFGLALHKAGVQFVRASGKASLSHTAVLAAATTGLDTII